MKTPIWLLISLFCAACAPAFVPLVTLEDPRGDDHGPGSYRYPQDRLHAPGSYDLTRVSLAIDGEDVVIRVEVSGSFEVALGQDAGRNNANRALPLSARAAAPSDGGLVLQNIELYLDTDANPQTGERRVLPGRGVELSSGWERAVWICPRPQRARAALERRDPALSGRVLVADSVLVRGRVLTARVPRALLGDPSPQWGFVVLMMGALPDDALNGKDGPLLVRPVLVTPDADAFQGDGPPVIDLWVPAKASPSQEELLRASRRVVPSRHGDGALASLAGEKKNAPEKFSASEAKPTQDAASEAKPTQDLASGPKATGDLSPTGKGQNPAPPRETENGAAQEGSKGAGGASAKTGETGAGAGSQPSAAVGDVLAEVIEEREGVLSLKAPAGALEKGRLGAVEGQPGLLLVVTDSFGELYLARRLAPGPVLSSGSRVRFSAR
jgi:hypothetical protein